MHTRGRSCFGTWLVLLALICVAGWGRERVLVPTGEAPIVDGALADGEWSDALDVPLGDEAMLYIQHADGYLYLGIQAKTMGVPSPLVVRGEEIHVLHASAALGTAIYAADGEAWTLRQGFVWQCRTPGFSSDAVAQRSAFLEQEGWLGTIGYLGEPDQFEYQIAWNGEPLRMLFLFLETSDPLRLLSWPLSSEATAGYLEIITGPTPIRMGVAIDDWALLVLDSALDVGQP